MRSGGRSLGTALLFLVVAGLGCAGIEAALMYSAGGSPPWQVLLVPLLGLVYLAVGVAAWARRPSNQIGPLLVVGGFAWLAAALENVSTPALVAVGSVTATVPLAVTVQLLHAFPSGTLRGRLSLWTVAVGYLVCVVLQAPLYVFGPGPLQLADRPHLARIGQLLQVGVGSAVTIATVVVLARRLTTMSPRQRPVIGPLYAYGILAVVWIPAAANLRWLAPFDPVELFEAQVLALAGVPVAFVLALLLGGFARAGELDELGAWLGEQDGGRPALAEALADVLGDPSLQLAFWVEEARGYVDAAGRPVALPAAGSDRAAVEVERAGARVGAIVYDATLIADAPIVRAAGRIVALALERERLTAALRASGERLRTSRARVVEAADAERRRIARDLHDGLQTQLVLLAVHAHDLAGGSELLAGLQSAIRSLRELVHGFMPPALAEGGLYAAVEDLADQLPMPARLELDPERQRLPAPVETAGYYVVSEALANAIKHSQARELRIGVARRNGALRIVVADDGVGGAHHGAGSGLRGIAERVEALEGSLRLESPPGRGTLLVAEVPCGS